MLQALNILENFDLKAMGYNSARYIHTVYQAMNLAFADRDFYYGDPYFPPDEPIKGLLSKDYAKARAALVKPRAQRRRRSARAIRIRSRAEANPFKDLLEKRATVAPCIRRGALRGGNRSGHRLVLGAARRPWSRPTRTAGSSR